MSGDAGFEFVEHTADLGIHAWAPGPGRAFAQAARGLFAYILDVEHVRPAVAHEVRAAAGSPERLLYQFLDEVLFLHQTELLAFSAFDAHLTPPAGAADDWTLRAVARGEAWDAERHGHIHEIKAVTFHDLRVALGPPADVFVVVDI